MPTALYRLYNAEDVLLYVGVANRIEERLGSHSGTKLWWAEVVRTEVEWFGSRDAAEKAEAVAINSESPLYNIFVPDLDGSGKGRIRYDAPPIAWSRGNPQYRSQYRLRREARERRAEAEATRPHATS